MSYKLPVFQAFAICRMEQPLTLPRSFTGQTRRLIPEFCSGQSHHERLRSPRSFVNQLLLTAFIRSAQALPAYAFICAASPAGLVFQEDILN
jgi:hypothetical protein